MKTALYERHKQLGAKFVSFGEWEMPLQYRGAVHEQKTVREKVGIFDVSHMGRVFVEGPDAELLLDLLSASQITDKPDFSATYTAWCLPSGGCVDDLIIYRFNNHKFFVIFNANNRQKDLDHLKKYAVDYDVTITDRYKEDGILSVQGPHAKELIVGLFPEAAQLHTMQFTEIPYEHEQVVISATGYTGAGGYELFGKNELLCKLWDTILERGKPLGIEPVGLAARDILRLEMGYALYGHEINETIAPTESVLARTVKLDKSSFIGKDVLLELEGSLNKRCEQGLLLMDPGVAREGYTVFKDGRDIGVVTSGGYSPSLEKSIAVALLSSKQPIDTIVEIAIRQNLCKAKIVKLPFLNVRAQ
jgi:aminomethyltransferase